MYARILMAAGVALGLLSAAGCGGGPSGPEDNEPIPASGVWYQKSMVRSDLPPKEKTAFAWDVNTTTRLLWLSGGVLRECNKEELLAKCPVIAEAPMTRAKLASLGIRLLPGDSLRKADDPPNDTYKDTSLFAPWPSAFPPSGWNLRTDSIEQAMVQGKWRLIGAMYGNFDIIPVTKTWSDTDSPSEISFQGQSFRISVHSSSSNAADSGTCVIKDFRADFGSFFMPRFYGDYLAFGWGPGDYDRAWAQTEFEVYQDSLVIGYTSYMEPYGAGQMYEHMSWTYERDAN